MNVPNPYSRLEPRRHRQHWAWLQYNVPCDLTTISRSARGICFGTRNLVDPRQRIFGRSRRVNYHSHHVALGDCGSAWRNTGIRTREQGAKCWGTDPYASCRGCSTFRLGSAAEWHAYRRYVARSAGHHTGYRLPGRWRHNRPDRATSSRGLDYGGQYLGDGRYRCDCGPRIGSHGRLVDSDRPDHPRISTPHLAKDFYPRFRE